MESRSHVNQWCVHCLVRGFSPCPCIGVSLVLKPLNSGVEGFVATLLKSQNHETLIFEQGFYVVLTL